MRARQIDAEDERFMREALAEARLAADEGEVPIGAVVVHDGRIVARAHNRRELDEDPSAHAEFAAMVAAAKALGRWRLFGCTVYVTLEPCLMCAGLMVNARIDRCVYGAADPKGGAVGTLYDISADARLNHAFEVTPGVLKHECTEVLQQFFANLRAEKRSDAPKLDRETASESACASTSIATSGFCTCKYVEPKPRILLAVDSFKGSASSAQAEAWLEEGILRTEPNAHVTRTPIADGGEGTLEVLHATRGGVLHKLRVNAPFGKNRICASYLLLDATRDATRTGKTAVIEMAQAAGLDLSPATSEAALAASTRDVGDLILDAISQGARTIYIGLGGSATSDGGAGMLQALGAQLLDADGASVKPGLRGLQDIASIDLASARHALAGVQLIALTDVTNPLVGQRGAIHVFGPQKGLGANTSEPEKNAALATYDAWMTAYASRLTAARDALDGTPSQIAQPGKRPKSLAGVPGAGAAGGLGAALLALGAQLKPGIETILDLTGFDNLARQADLIVTGEGSLDGQTAAGKAPVGVARRAKAVNPQVPVIAICGGRADTLDSVYQQGIDLALPILRHPMSLEEALAPQETRLNLIAAGETIARLLTL